VTKRSRYERERRAAQNEGSKAIGEAWWRAISPADAEAFVRQVDAARSRPPVVREDMAPGTPPNPPRVVREVRPNKDEPRRRY
jgi:hypothetical protein